MAHVDVLELFAEEDLEPTVMTVAEEEEDRPLDCTIPAILLTKDEWRLPKDQKKSRRRKEKNAEQNQRMRN